MSKHAFLAPSSAHRWMNCPGCVALCEGVPKTSKPAAEEGSAAHWLAEQFLTAFKALRPAPIGLEGKWIAKDSHGYLVVPGKTKTPCWEITADMLRHIATYVDFVIEETRARKAQLLIETRVQVGDQCFGTADATIYEPRKRALVADFKYGAGVSVDAEENDQLLCYGVGVLGLDPEMEEIELVIIQPRDRNNPVAIRRWVIQADRLRSWHRDVLVPAAKRALSENAPLKSGAWCRWCEADAICPEVVNKALAVAGTDFENVKVPDPRILADTDLAKVLNASQLIRGWAASVEEYALERMQGGIKVEGWKLVQKKANRKFPDEDRVAQILKPKFGEEIYDQKLKSPKGMEDLCKAKGVDPKKALDGLWIIPDNGLTIAPVSDRRKAVTPMEVEFQDPAPDLSFLE